MFPFTTFHSDYQKNCITEHISHTLKQEEEVKLFVPGFAAADIMAL